MYEFLPEILYLTGLAITCIGAAYVSYLSERHKW
jgi:hypothetical protein